MYSGDAPSSYPPGGVQTSGVQIQTTGDVYSQPPSRGDMNHDQRNSLNQFQGTTTYRGLGQPSVIGDNTKPPSFTDFDHGQRMSYNHNLNVSRESGGSYYGHSAYGQAPSVGAMGKINVSQTTSDGQVDSYIKDVKAPGRSDVDRRGSSETGEPASVKLDVTDAKELVGISLVGSNFRKFYPNAYYREEDEEEDD